LKKLIGLVNVLRPGEKELLRNLYRSNRAGDRILRSELFELIDKGRVKSDEEARLKLKGADSSSAYAHLKNRLREDILSVLLLQESPKRIAQANRAAVFECWKKLTQAYVLIFRGAKSEGAEILKNAERLADKYELAAEKLLIRHVTREALYSISDVSELNYINRSIQSDLSTFQSVLRSEEISFLITLPALRREMLSKEGEGFEDRIIQELEDLFNSNGTARIGFWYYMAYTDYMASSGKHYEAIKSGLEFLKLVEENPSVRSKNNMAGVNLTLGTSYLQIRNYRRAVSHLAAAEQMFSVRGFNRLQTQEFLVQGYAGDGNYSEALVCVERALSHPRIDAREALVPRWLYFKSCIEFLNDDTNESFRTLNQDSYIIRQVDEWNVQFRFLEMMQLIEFKDEDWLEFKVNATRKFLNRHKELATPRARLALDVFSNLLRNGLDFEGLSQKNIDSLRECIREDGEFSWNPASPELVRFDNWVVSKIPNWNEVDQSEEE